MTYKVRSEDKTGIYARVPLLFGVATLLAGVLFFLLVWRTPASSGGLSLDKTKYYFLKGDYSSAISEGERVIAQAGKDYRGLNELYYMLGVSYMKDGNLLRASDIFEIILNETRSPHLHEEAEIGLADTFFLRGDYDTAGKLYKEMLEKKVYARFADALYYRLSRCAEKKGDKQAFEEYSARISGNFPLPKESNGLDVLQNPGFYYAVQLGSFSREANAGNFRDELIKKGYDAYLEKAVRTANAGALFRVKVGKFSDRAEAESVAKKLSKEGYPTRICP